MDRVKWLEERLEAREPWEREFFLAFTVGVMESEAEHFPERTYTVKEVAQILRIAYSAGTKL